MGKLLENEKEINSYNIQDGNVLHLIANLEDKERNNEPENNEEDGKKSIFFVRNLNLIADIIEDNEEEEQFLNERAEQEILAGIFRTLSNFII